MAITTNNDVLAYLAACGQAIPAGLSPLVTLARNAAERGLLNYLGYSPEQRTVTEYLPQGTGNLRADGDAISAGFDLSPGGMVLSRGVARTTRREVILANIPVVSIASVYDNPAAWNTAGGDWPATSLLPSNVYYLDSPDADGLCWSGIVYRNAGSWATLPRAIKITYTAGLTTQQLAEDGSFPEFRMAVLTAAAINLGKIIARGRVALTGHVVSSVSIEDFAASFSGAGGAALGSADGVGLAGVDFPTESRMWVKTRRHMAGLV